MTSDVHPGLDGDADGTARLVDERDFLLRSLDDLEEERAAGNIDGETYARLHADYTARAAAAVRALRDGVDARPSPVSASPGRRVLVLSALGAFAIVAAVALAFALGARLPGQSATGRAPDQGEQASPAARRGALEAAVAANPDDVEARLALARLLLGTQEYPGALRQFDAAARLDPANGEARAYAGWILFLVSQQADDAQRAELVTAGRERLDEAVRVAPQFADAHFFRGMVLYRGQGDPAAAIPEFQQYLVLEPQGPLGEQVRTVLAQAVADATP